MIVLYTGRMGDGMSLWSLGSKGPRLRGVGSSCDHVPGDVVSALPCLLPRGGRSKPTGASPASGAERRLIYSKDTLEHAMEKDPNDVLWWGDRVSYTVMPVGSDEWFFLTRAEVPAG